MNPMNMSMEDDCVVLKLTDMDIERGKIYFNINDVHKMLDLFLEQEPIDYLANASPIYPGELEWEEFDDRESCQYQYDTWIKSGRYSRVSQGFRYRNSRGIWEYKQTHEWEKLA